MSDRRTDADFEKIIAGAAPEVQALARSARAMIFSVLPEAFEVVWTRQKIAGYGTGPKKMTEHFSWIATGKAYARLGFNYGAELPDTGKLLEGTGAKMRHVKLKEPGDVKKPALKKLLQAAVKHRVPPPKPL